MILNASMSVCMVFCTFLYDFHKQLFSILPQLFAPIRRHQVVGHVFPCVWMFLSKKRVQDLHLQLHGLLALPLIPVGQRVWMLLSKPTSKNEVKPAS